MPASDAADWMRGGERATDAESDVIADSFSQGEIAGATGSFVTVAADVPSMSKWAANSGSVNTRSPFLSSFWKNS